MLAIIRDPTKGSCSYTCQDFVGMFPGGVRFQVERSFRCYYLTLGDSTDAEIFHHRSKEFRALEKAFAHRRAANRDKYHKDLDRAMTHFAPGDGKPLATAIVVVGSLLMLLLFTLYVFS